VKAIVPVAAMLALVPVIRTSGSSDAPPTVRVLTYNIHHGEGRDGQFDLARLARIISSTQADLVALQEVDVRTARSSGVDQLTELERLTGLHGEFGKAMDFQGGSYGIAVLSRWPLLRAENNALPSSGDREPRTELTVWVRLWGRGPLLQFTSTHFDQLRAEERLAQAQNLNQRLIHSDVPGILAGDMNARAETDVMNVFQASWTEAAIADPAPSDAPRPFFPRGDHVLFRPAADWKPLESRFVDERVASDHRPILVVLEWTGKR
jgi:endonuclease/exonuclease/phosphatase family metal-dependent hydrolase